MRRGVSKLTDALDEIKALREHDEEQIRRYVQEGHNVGCAHDMVMTGQCTCTFSKQAKPLRWQDGLPLGDDKELTEDVLIAWQGNGMDYATYCIGQKGNHPVTDDVKWVKYIPLRDILDLIGGE